MRYVLQGAYVGAEQPFEVRLFSTLDGARRERDGLEAEAAAGGYEVEIIIVELPPCATTPAAGPSVPPATPPDPARRR